jgi:phenylalanyl-tRNA synthetase beta chain
MRTLLSPNLLQVIARNQAFGTSDVCVFEIGKVYFRTAGGDIDEKMSVAGALAGNVWDRAWNVPQDAMEADFYMCKGIVEALLQELGVDGAKFEPVLDVLYHPTRAARVVVGERELGVLGEASETLCETLDVSGRVYMYELDFAALLEISPDIRFYNEVPRYPGLERHVNAVVGADVAYSEVESAVLATGGDLVESVALLDEYRGEHVEEGRRSLTLSMVFRSRERTLRDEEVNASLAEIKGDLSRKFGADFR